MAVITTRRESFIASASLLRVNAKLVYTRYAAKLIGEYDKQMKAAKYIYRQRGLGVGEKRGRQAQPRYSGD
jgi:hypothetical protein